MQKILLLFFYLQVFLCIPVKSLDATDSTISTVINTPILEENPQSKYNGWTLIHYICADRITELIRLIVEKDLEVNNNDPDQCSFNIQDKAGNTPLHLLCLIYRPSYYDNKNTIESVDNPVLQQIMYLVGNGARFDIKNLTGKTPDELTDSILIHNVLLQYKYCHQETFTELSGKIPIPFYRRAINNTNSMFAGPMFGRRGSSRATVSSAFGQPGSSRATVSSASNLTKTELDRAWKALLSAKSNDSKKWTLLHFLCAGNRLGAIKFLVEKGANVELTAYEREYSNSGFDRYSANAISFAVLPFHLLFLSLSEKFRLLPNASITDIEEKRKKEEEKRKEMVRKVEEIAEYLFRHGTKTVQEIVSMYPICKKSDLLYRLYKEEKHEAAQ